MIRKTLAAAALLALSSTAFGAHIASGTLDSSDPLWDGCGSGTGCYYDILQINISVTGLYTFTGQYAGTVPDTNLDGILEIYEGSFDPASPGLNAIAFDDDYTDTGGFPACTGSNCSQIAGVAMTAGTTYFLVISSFTNVGNSFGQPTGPWEVIGTGAGAVEFKDVVIPIPGAIWLMISGLAGLGAMRRRRS